MYDRVTQTAPKEPAVHRERDDPRQSESEREAGPEEQAVEARVHGAGDGQDHGVVDDLHDRDRHDVGGEGDPGRGTDAMPDRSSGRSVRA